MPAPDPNGPVTRADLHEALGAVRIEFRGELTEQFDRLEEAMARLFKKYELANREHIHKFETKLLTAFQGYSTTEFVRMQKLQAGPSPPSPDK